MAREVGGTTRIDLGGGASLEVKRLTWREEMALRKRHPAPEGDAAKAETPEQVSARNVAYALDGVASCVVAMDGFTTGGVPTIDTTAVVGSPARASARRSGELAASSSRSVTM